MQRAAFEELTPALCEGSLKLLKEQVRGVFEVKLRVAWRGRGEGLGHGNVWRRRALCALRCSRECCRGNSPKLHPRGFAVTHAPRPLLTVDWLADRVLC